MQHTESLFPIHGMLLYFFVLTVLRLTHPKCKIQFFSFLFFLFARKMKNLTLLVLKIPWEEIQKNPKWAMNLESFTQRGCPIWICLSSSCRSCARCGFRCCSSGGPRSATTPRRRPSGRSRRWQTCRQTASAVGSSVSGERSEPARGGAKRGREKVSGGAWTADDIQTQRYAYDKVNVWLNVDQMLLLAINKLLASFWPDIWALILAMTL